MFPLTFHNFSEDNWNCNLETFTIGIRPTLTSAFCESEDNNQHLWKRGSFQKTPTHRAHSKQNQQNIIQWTISMKVRTIFA